MIFNQRVVQLTGARIALAAPTEFTASPGNQQVSLTWEDPGDETSGGQVVASWEFTQIVRKVGSPPVNQTDGTIVTVSTVKNQYMSEPFIDTGLTNGTTYYYGAFACSAAGAWSDGVFAGAIPVLGTELGNFAEGTLINIQENGSPVQFYVAKQGYEPTLNGPNRVLMVRKDIYDQMQWSDKNFSAWVSSTLLLWLNENYKSLFSGAVQTLIGTTKYEYTVGGAASAINTRSDAIFSLSSTELDKKYYDANIEGSALPIATTLQIAYYNGSPAVQWTRSPVVSGAQNAMAVYLGLTGNSAGGFCNSSHGVRPCFTLPKNALVDPDMNLIESSDIPPIETPLGDLVEGTLITIQESGVPVEFYVAKQNYEEGLNGKGRVLCVRKDIYVLREWNNTQNNSWVNSTIFSWLNETYKGVLSSNVQTLIDKTQYVYTPGGGNYTMSTRSDSIFLLSGWEFGEPFSDMNNEGTELPISQTLHTALYNGSAYGQWTRSPGKSGSTNAYAIYLFSFLRAGLCDNIYGARPCFTLPSTAFIDSNLALIEEV